MDILRTLLMRHLIAIVSRWVGSQNLRADRLFHVKNGIQLLSWVVVVTINDELFELVKVVRAQLWQARVR